MIQTKSLWINILLMPAVLVAIFFIAISFNSAYLAMLNVMPEAFREKYCNYVLQDDGFISGQLSKVRLLTLFVNNSALFPPNSYSSLSHIAIKYPDENIGIIALQITFEIKNREMVCSLWGKEQFRDHFLAKLLVYQRFSPIEDYLELEKIIGSCYGESEVDIRSMLVRISPPGWEMKDFP